ncbi:MAG: peptide chain release factor 2 [Candidatus Eisenbacteria bacterium]|uniref:Peptide chain release factor 2 n=1 Tax=Eiseniibacteriota bacterium TaxID=2212470 RepID=A0A538UER4_UNCEI|nr:MAG: peptide chain release factor 2 [Candidatus Eisenbacteria bacterium]
MSEPGFWDRPDDARRTVAALKHAKRTVDDWSARQGALEHLGGLLELAEGESDEALLADLSQELEGVETRIADLELRSLLSGEHDALGALIIIHPGAGGTESQDWADMLLRMYLRWAERHGFPTRVLDLQPGDEAGIKDATVEIDGEYAYGHLKGESGVHRLVRISPYDAAKRRHTSFASVHVTPMVDDTITVDIAPADLRIDTFRASGAGGQHVNKTESAVRITHLPTNLVVQSQAERSQHRNRENALRILRSRLFVHLQEIARQKTEARSAPKKDIDFGSQIRSYVLQPYTMVKDERTELKVGDVHAVLDGALDPFIDAYLKHKTS